MGEGGGVIVIERNIMEKRYTKDCLQQSDDYAFLRI